MEQIMRRTDWHCDTITALTAEETLTSNQKSITVDGLVQSNTSLQCFAAFIPCRRDGMYVPYDDLTHQFLSIHERYQNALKSNSSALQKVLTYNDYRNTREHGCCGCLFTLEDGGLIGTEMERIRMLWEHDIRLITLTWNFENSLGYPNTNIKKDNEKTLTPFGREAVRYMEETGIIVDVSHLNDGGFYDVASIATKPFVASHSNARAICNHPRNLTDDMIRVIANKGGIIGLNFYYAFLQTKPSDDVSRVNDMVNHVWHIYQTGGEDVLAMGSDFDGISGTLEIASPIDCDKLYTALHKKGMSLNVLEKMWEKNTERVLREI